MVLNHYLHSLPGGTILAFGVFLDGRLLGVITFGAGPANAYRLIDGASRDDCLVLTRLWLADELPRNSESKVIGMALRALKRLTSVKFVVTYADPSQGHLGTIYQASNWIYTGLSEASPLYKLGGGPPIHSRSFSHKFGTRSTDYFAARGVPVTRIPQAAKLRYFYFLDARWRRRLKVPALPYLKKEASDDGCG